jgi:predicted O-methyltransferase YrrM
MKAIPLTDDLYSYVVNHCELPHPILRELAEETAKMPRSMMQISPDQGAFMSMLAKIIGAKRIIEIGCFTGYSAICMAQAIPEDGQLITLDIDPEVTAIAQRYFNKASLDKKIKIMLGKATESLTQIKTLYGPSAFDMAFIDADKAGAIDYLNHCYTLLRKGGLVLVDNTLWSGKVADQKNNEPDTVAMRAFNDYAFKDKRFEKCLLNIADGLYLLRKL